MRFIIFSPVIRALYDLDKKSVDRIVYDIAYEPWQLTDEIMDHYTGKNNQDNDERIIRMEKKSL